MASVKSDLDNEILGLLTEGYTNSEIGRKVGISGNAVNMRIKRLKQRKPEMAENIIFKEGSTPEENNVIIVAKQVETVKHLSNSMQASEVTEQAAPEPDAIPKQVTDESILSILPYTELKRAFENYWRVARQLSSVIESHDSVVERRKNNIPISQDELKALDMQLRLHEAAKKSAAEDLAYIKASLSITVSCMKAGIYQRDIASNWDIEEDQLMNTTMNNRLNSISN